MNNTTILKLLSLILMACPMFSSGMNMSDNATKETKQIIEIAKPENQSYKLLLNACLKGNLGLVKHLIEKVGLDINFEIKSSQIDVSNTPFLRFVCANASLEIIKYLIENGADIHANSKEITTTPVALACAEGKYDIVKYLVENGANINFDIHFICLIKNPEIIKYVIENGCNINSDNYMQITPLQYACINGNLNLVKYLLENGANIHATNQEKWTALHYACIDGQYEIAKYLIAKKANINAIDHQNRTPLHYAVFMNHETIVKLLLDANAKITIEESEFDFTALDWAYDINNPCILKHFKESGVLITSEKRAEENMRTFFAELEQEDQTNHITPKKKQKNTKAKKKLPNHSNALIISDKNEQKTEQTINHSTSSTITTVPKKITTTITTDPLATPKIASEIMTINNSLNNSSNNSTPVNTITNTTVSKKPTTLTTTPKNQNTNQTARNKPTQVNQTNNTFQIGYDNKLKWPRSLQGKQYETMRDQLRQLKYWPIQTNLDIKPLTDQPDKYRLRVGGYRVLFYVDQELRRIVIYEIGLRKKIYRNI